MTTKHKQNRRRKRFNKSLWITLGIINALCLAAFVLWFAIAIPSFGEWFYIWQYNANDTYAVVNMEREHLMEVTRHMIAYMRGLTPDLQISTIVGGQPRYFFSPIEIRHMIDVYELFAAGQRIINFASIAFAATALLFVLGGRRRLRTLFRCWRNTAVAVFVGAIVLVAAIAINWHHAFVVFHEILFNNDYWILDNRVDLLINIVPYDFFITISIVIGGFFVLGLGIIFITSAILLRRTRWRRLLVLLAAIAVPLLIFGIFSTVMFIALLVLLGLLALILLLIVIALFTKISYEANVKKSGLDAPLEYNVRVRALWGLLKKEITDEREESKEPRAESREPRQDIKADLAGKTGDSAVVESNNVVESADEDEEKKSIFGTLREMGWDTIRAIIGHTLVLIKKVFRVFYPKNIYVRGKYGAAEPDTTGMVLGAIGVVSGALGFFANIEGDFENEVLEVEMHIKGYLRLWALLVPLVRYIFKPEIKPIIFGFLFKSKPKTKTKKEN